MPIQVPQMSRRQISAEGIFAAINVVLENHKRQAGQSIFLTLNPRVRNLLLRLRVRLPAPNFDQVSQNISQEVAQETLETIPKVADLAQTPEVVADSLIETLLVEPQIEAPLKKYQDDPEKLLPQVAPIANEVATIHQKDLETAAVLGKIAQIGALVETTPEIKASLDETIEETVVAQHPTIPRQDLGQIKASGIIYIKSYSDEIVAKVLPLISESQVPNFGELQKLEEQSHQKASTAFQASVVSKKTDISQLTPSEITSNVAYDFGLRPENTDHLNKIGLGPAAQTANSLSSSAPISQKGIGVAIALNQNLAGDASYTLLSTDRPRDEKSIKFFEGEVAKTQGRPAPSYRQLKRLREIKRLLAGLRFAQNFSARKTQRAQNLRNFFANLRQPGRRLPWAVRIAWQSFTRQGPFIPRYLTYGTSFAPQRMVRAMAYQLGNYKMGKRGIIMLGRNPLSTGSVLNRWVLRRTGPTTAVSHGRTTFTNTIISIVTFPIRKTVSTIFRLTGTVLQVVGRAITSTLGRIPIIGIPFAALGIGLSGLGRALSGFGRFGGAAGVVGGVTGAVTSVASIVTLPIRNTINLVKRAAVAIGAGLGLLFYLFGIKIIGAGLGILFGLATGWPLLFLGPPGILLYAGYTALWGIIGFNNPQLMFNIYDGILHPFDTLGRIFGPVGEAISSPGSWLGSGGVSLASFVGNGIFNTIQFLWNGFVTLGQGLLGALGAFADFFLGIGGLSLSGMLVAVPVFGSILALIGTAVLIIVLNNSSTQSQNLISKTANVDSSDNIAYQIKVHDNCLPNFNITDNLPSNVTLTGDKPTITILNPDAVDGQPTLVTPTDADLKAGYSGPITWSVNLKQSYVSNCQISGYIPYIDYFIPFRNTKVQVINEQAVKDEVRTNHDWPYNFVDKICPDGGTLTCWDYIKSEALKAGVNPAFPLAIWIAESGASGSNLTPPDLSGHLSCPNGGVGLKRTVADLVRSVDCFINSDTHANDGFKGAESYPGDYKGFVEMLKYFCDPNTPNVCEDSNNPGQPFSFVKSLHDWYSKLVPPGNYGALTEVNTTNSTTTPNPQDAIKKEFNITMNGFDDQHLQWAYDELKQVNTSYPAFLRLAHMNNPSPSIIIQNFARRAPGNTWHAWYSYTYGCSAAPGSTNIELVQNQNEPQEEIFKITLVHELGHMVKKCPPKELSKASNQEALFYSEGGVTMYAQWSNHTSADAGPKYGHNTWACPTGGVSNLNEDYAEMLTYVIFTGTPQKDVCFGDGTRLPNPYDNGGFPEHKALANQILNE